MITSKFKSLRKAIERKHFQKEVMIDQEVYVLLDLIEEELDLYTTILGVYSEQVAGFYDDDCARNCSLRTSIFRNSPSNS